jgi:N-acetylneuraminate lyase
MCDEKIDLGRVANYAGFLKSGGVAGAFVNGTTGEGMSLTSDERMALVEEWVKYKSDDFKVIVHVGHNSLVDSVRYARHAVECGVDALGLMPPFFFKPELGGLIKYIEEVASSAGDLPIYYYHIPSISGGDFSVYDLLCGCSGISNFKGVKFTHENMMDFRDCISKEDGRYDMLWGRDEICLAGLSMGARGFVGSTYNFMAPLYLRICSLFESGDIEGARLLQDLSIAVIKVMISCGNGVVGGKAIMKIAGMDVGETRLPLLRLDDACIDDMKMKLDELGFFDWVNGNS